MTLTTDQLETALRETAKGNYTYEAATELLIRTGWTRRGSFLVDCVSSGDEHAWVEWETLGAILRGEQESGIMAASGGELRVLRIAYSLAGNGLGDAVPGLDRKTLALVLAAIAHAGGSHEHSEMVTGAEGRWRDKESGQRVAFKQLGSLYPWPEA